MTWVFVPASQFAEHAQQWDGLQRRTTNTPFFDSAFLLPLLQEFGSGREVLAMDIQADGAAAAAALLRPGGRGMWETFQPSQLPLGPWLCGPGEALLPRMRGLVAALPGLALGLGLTQLDPKLQNRGEDDAHVRTLDYIDSSYIDIQGGWDLYWEARGKNLRQNTRKQHNKLVAEGSLPQLDCLTQAEAVAAAVAEFGALESAGWKAGGGTAIHADNAQGRFYTRMLENFCARGQGRIYRYRFGDKVVAMDLCIDNGPLVVILKTAYDESYRSVSPSTLMRHDQFKAWWAEGQYQRIEFYGKTMEWHTRWTEQERRLYHATCYRWPLVRSLHDRLRARRQAPGAEPALATAAATEAMKVGGG